AGGPCAFGERPPETALLRDGDSGGSSSISAGPRNRTRADRGRDDRGYDVPKAALSLSIHMFNATIDSLPIQVRSGAVRSRFGRAHAALGIFPVWRWSPSVHRQWLRNDKGGIGSSDGGAVLQVGVGAR